MSNIFNLVYFKPPLVFVFVASLLLAACAPEAPSHEDIVRVDLAIIIDSLGSSCDKVLEYEATGELEYTVVCQSGGRYVVSVNPQGQVGVSEHN